MARQVTGSDRGQTGVRPGSDQAETANLGRSWPRRTRNTRLAILALSVVSAIGLSAQPTNDLPNPYQTIEHFFKMPEGRTWGATSAVGVDRDGKSIWVGERCGANSCLGSKLDSILKFDASGTLVKSFGAGTMIFPHGMHVDKDGNIWVTDGQDNRPRRARGAAAGLSHCRRRRRRSSGTRCSSSAPTASCC